jgi:hypothetical protein
MYPLAAAIIGGERGGVALSNSATRAVLATVNDLRRRTRAASPVSALLQRAHLASAS